MTDINAEELRDALMPIADEARAKLRIPNLPPLAVARYDAALGVLGSVFIFLDNAIKQGEVDMDRLKDSVKVQFMRMGEIPARHYKNEVADKVKGWIKELQEVIAAAEKEKYRDENGRPRPYDPSIDKPVRRIDPEEMKAGYLNSLVAQMREDKEVPNNIRVMQRKDENGVIVGFLVELEPNQLEAREKQFANRK